MVGGAGGGSRMGDKEPAPREWGAKGNRGTERGLWGVSTGLGVPRSLMLGRCRAWRYFSCTVYRIHVRIHIDIKHVSIAHVSTSLHL